MSGDERGTRGTKGKKQAWTRDTAARRGRGVGGEQRQSGAPHRQQSNAMPITHIEPYGPPRPTIRELMEGRPAGVDDGGIPPKGYLGRPPKSAYRTEDRAQAERRVRVRDTALARRGAAQRTRGTRAAVRGTGERQATGVGRGIVCTKSPPPTPPPTYPPPYPPLPPSAGNP